MSRLKVTVGDATPALFNLLDDVAPETVAALCKSLPIRGVVTHARWAGSACWVKTDREPIGQLNQVEHPVTSIYPGFMVVRPSGTGVAEIFIAYGPAESRGPMGRTYASPVAQLSGDSDALFEALGRTWAQGATQIQIELDPAGD